MMKKITLFIIIIFLMATPVSAQEQKTKDTLVIAISNDFEPFTFLNAEGRPAGMFVDIWRLWAQKTGKQIKFISSDWKTSIENLKNQKADIHSGFLYSPEHFEWISGSQPFYEVGVSLFYPLKQGNISDIKELSGYTVAAIRGSQLEQFLKKHYPGIRVYPCDTREELVRVTREGKAKGFIAILPVGAAVIDRMGLSGEFGTYDRILYKEIFLSGVLKKNTELLALVDKGFNAISYKERSEIEARWIPDPAKQYYKASRIIQLTPQEEAWLKKHKTIRVGMSPVFPPLKFSEKGVIKGIEPDYLNLLAEYTGIQFEYVVSDLSVMDAKVKSGEIDIFLSFYIPERFTYMTLTEPFMEFKQVIVARMDAPFMSGISALKGKKVAAARGVKLYDKLFSPYPEIEVVQVGTSEEMFKAVSEFKADALISRSYIAGYVMQNYPNLKIAGIADLPPEPYYYAVRKDYPELVSVLNKAIASIPREKHDAIVQKWVSVRFEYRPNWSEILKWAFVIGGAFAIILGMSLVWNRRLAREIKKRKQAAEALSQVAREWQTTFDAAKDVIWLLDKEQRVVRSNKTSERLFQRPCGELVGKHCWEIVHGTNQPIPECPILHAKKSLRRETMELQIGGSWFGITVDPILDAAGQYAGAVHVVSDITDRKQAAEALSESEKNLRTLYESMSEGIVYEDHDGKIISANPAAERLLGLSLSQMQGRTSIDPRRKAIHEDGSPFPGETHSLRVAAMTGKPGHDEVMGIYNPQSGDYIWLNINSTPEFLPGEKEPFRAFAVFRDITKRKQAEDKIFRQSRLLAAINRIFYETLTADSEEAVAKACLGVVREITDSKFGFIGEITPEGLFKTTALSDPGWEICRIPETQAIVLIKDMVIRGIWGQVILAEHSLIVNDPVSCPDRVGIPEGHPPLTSFLGVPLKEQGKVIGMIAMANRESGYTADQQHDLEALSVAFVEAIYRKRAEEKSRELNEYLEKRVIERTAQLEAANKELEAFSYSVSHDLRTPLRGINGFSQALLEDYRDTLDDTAKSYLDRVRKATQHMGRLIDDMLKLSKATRAEFHHESVDLSTMVRAISEKLQQNNPGMTVDVIIREGIFVNGDRDLLQIALENLMDNAWKFTGRDEQPQVEFGTTVREGKTACFIRDNGAGFDMAYVDKLFGAFQRLHTSVEFPGTGIGLATVRRIINRHGGQVWAEAEVGKGAIFYFTLKNDYSDIETR